MGSRSKDIVTSYLDTLNNQDFSAARSYLKNDMTFQSPVSLQNGADAYINDMERLRSKYKIKTVLYDIKKVILDDDDVCVFFDFNIGPQSFLDADGFILMMVK